MSFSSAVRVISVSSLAILMSRGQTSDLTNGARKVSNVSYMSYDSLDSQATVEIPDELESAKTLEFLELNIATANEVYNNYLDFKAQNPDRADILHFAKDHVHSVAGDALVETDDWRGVMQRIGLTSNYQNRVMDPAWKHMRVNATAKETAIWMMEMRFEFLETLDSFIQAPGKGMNRKVSHLDLSGKLQLGAPAIPPRAGSKNKGQPSIGEFTTAASSSLSSSKAEDSQTSIKDCQFFYKGGSVPRLEAVNNADGQLSFQRLVSTPPGDFDTPGKVGLYFTKQEKVAYEYAEWAKKVVDGNVVPVGLLCVAVPNNLLSSIIEVFGDNWRRYVWSCRHQDFPPQDLEHLSNFQWITGPLCRQSNAGVLRMSNYSELVAWKLEKGETASQHFTASSQMFQLLNNNCKGKIWITNVAGKGK